MVATTFAADTPLLVTELVRTDGISGNWLWWSLLAGGVFTSFFFARYWRRSGALTDLEFLTLRYAGRPMHLLRGFRAVYLGLLLNALIMAWVNLALLTLLEVFFPGIPSDTRYLILLALIGFTLLYVTLAGLKGVMYTDVLQFGVAMAGSIALAVFVLSTEQVSGLAGLKAQLPEAQLRFFPTLSTASGDQLALGLGAFLSMMVLQWWASWYPGNEPGGGGYVAQRMLATRNERHAVGATFLFQVFHYAVRPWPWIIVGLAAVVLYPGLPDAAAREGYVMAMQDHLPAGWRGLLLAGFFAAYLSTLSTQLNWGVSYLIGDCYRPYVRPNRTDSEYLRASRWLTLGVGLAGFGATFAIDSLAQAFELAIGASAGLGLVLMLRWYWWRISAWSELAATALPLVVYPVLLAIDASGAGHQLNRPDAFFGDRTVFVLQVGITTLSWVVVTFLTRPTPPGTLASFVSRVQPRGWWRGQNRPPHTDPPIWALWVGWLAGVAGIYSLLFGVGSLLFEPASSWWWGASTASCAALLVWLDRRYRLLGQPEASLPAPAPD